MPKRDKFLDEIKGDDGYGVFLAAQMGGVPEELQLILETARYDKAAGGLRPRARYVVRVLGVREHRMNLGIFGSLFFADQHPILFHHNEPLIEVHFEGKPKDVYEMVLDVQQAYVGVFGPLRDIATDINRKQPLATLLNSGGGLLGTFPKPAAEKMERVIQHHQMKAALNEVAVEKTDEHDHRPSPKLKLMGIDDSYFIALDFSIEEMGKI